MKEVEASIPKKTLPGEKPVPANETMANNARIIAKIDASQHKINVAIHDQKAAAELLDRLVGR